MTDKSTQEDFNDSELVIGLVGPIGVDFDKINDLLESQLRLYSYDVEKIRISESIIRQFENISVDGLSHYERFRTFMDAGDNTRKVTGDNSILAKGVAGIISSRRDDNHSFKPRTAYIIQSLKHEAEVHRLRMIYPHGFYLIGVNSSEAKRIEYLKTHKSMNDVQAKELIDRDMGDSNKCGQHTSNAFQLADFFINLDTNSKISNAIKRIVELLYGHPYRTPYFDEYAMFSAFTASLRSADLSRQVGAVIARDNEILSVGANDCPRYGGGLYWTEESEDGTPIDNENGRDWRRGYDANKIQLLEIICDIQEIAAGKTDIVDIKNSEKFREMMHEGPIGDLTEFGRIIHAEMEAILSCGRRGIGTIDSTLYCTTFPCHNCVKHIVASGIRRVVYIEPYPKSKAFKLHDDTVDDDPKTNGKVKLEPYVGVSPQRFFDLFSMKLGFGWKLLRKDKDGKSIAWDPKQAKLRVQMIPKSYLELESIAERDFGEKVEHARKSKKRNP